MSLSISKFQSRIMICTANTSPSTEGYTSWLFKLSVVHFLGISQRLGSFPIRVRIVCSYPICYPRYSKYPFASKQLEWSHHLRHGLRTSQNLEAERLAQTYSTASALKLFFSPLDRILPPSTSQPHFHHPLL